jgi:hypothetical protein
MKNMAKKTGKPDPKKQDSAKAQAGPRKIKPAKHQLKLKRRLKYPVKLPNVFSLTKTAALIFWKNKGVLTGIIIIYGLLNLILVQGLAGNTDVGSLKDSLNKIFTGHFGSLASSLGVFAVLVGSSGNGSSQTAGAYQFFLSVMASLAIIWALRQLLSGSGLRIRDAYYRGMYPLVPFILILFVIGLQLIPLVIGSSLYSLVMSTGIAASGLEKFLWTLIFLLLLLWSLYMVSASAFALYIVTLPDMTPLKALRNARELVKFRRWTVLRKLLWLPVCLLIVAALIMVPIIIWLTPLAQWVFFVLTMLSLLAIHTYIYTIYRELLHE